MWLSLCTPYLRVLGLRVRCVEGAAVFFVTPSPSCVAVLRREAFGSIVDAILGTIQRLECAMVWPSV